MSTPALDYALVDVFAERALEGNCLAIFTDARGLSTEQMQALARETNLPETTFILPEDDETHGVRVRIFTVREELPFAGHPTLGTASWLYLNHPKLKGSERITLRLNAGNITVPFKAPADGEAVVFGEMKQLDPTFGMLHSRSEVAAAIGVAEDDIEAQLPIQTVSTGLPFCIVPLTTLEAITKLSIPQVNAQAYLATTDAKFFYCTTPADPETGADFHSRMQFYNGEDPATGSASGCAIAYFVKHGVVPSGHSVVLEQGVEIDRPSRIYVRAAHSDGSVTDVFVSGRTIPVASGRFFQREI